jgi:N-acetylglucosaminyldiphosphoundecaprenol N-acetyl-beta-D-mannosaminyltransferase
MPISAPPGAVGSPAVPTVDLLGYRVVDAPVSRLAASICDRLGDPGSRSVVFLNPHSVVMARRDPALREALTRASFVCCDGVGVSLASLLINRRRIERIYGYAFFTCLSAELSARRTGRVYFVGGTEESLADILAQYRRDYPGLESVDGYAPPFRESFGPAEIAAIAARAAAARADVVWLGLGSPKQEKMLAALAEASGAHAAAAIGAVFDFYSGRAENAPAWIRRAGLEWAHRLVREPRRLWRRTLVSAPIFLGQIVGAALGNLFRRR